MCAYCSLSQIDSHPTYYSFETINACINIQVSFVWLIHVDALHQLREVEDHPPSLAWS